MIYIEQNSSEICIKNHTFWAMFHRWKKWSSKAHLVVELKLNTSWLDKNIKQNVKNECFGASCISGTLNLISLKH